MLENVLKKIGLSDKEIAVYLAVLQSAPSPVRSIAERADINRGTTYDILKQLQEMGLVSYYHQDKHQYFIAEDPSKLTWAVSQKQAQLEATKQEIENALPQLKVLYDRAGGKPVAKFYEGGSGLVTILTDVLSSCRQTKLYYVYSSTSIKKYLYEAYKNFSEDRKAAGIAVKTISIGPGGETVGLDERKWLSKDESAPTYTLIYAGKVAMISVDDANQPMGVLIEDKHIFQTQKMIFESLWKKL